ncbi:MAG: nodulation protein NfeD [Desulfosarcinaceae bacterium]
MRYLILPLLILGLLLCALPATALARDVHVIKVSDPIGPAVAEFIGDAAEKATEADAAALIIELDTPGGLGESMRRIVQAIYACQVPVVVYVTPSGARAASAGVMITMAADIAAMAPGTSIGAAHPVGAGGKEIEGTMAKKVTNDMVSFIKGIARRRGRNAAWAEKAVRESVSLTAEEALKENVIDTVATNLDDLFAKINGRVIEGKGKLELDKNHIKFIKENLRTRVLKAISDPNIAYILLMIGLAGLYFELSNPGVVFPGVVGAIALILAFYSMQTLPFNITGILLILLAVIFFILELKITSHGLLSFAGLLTLVLGSMMLFKGAGPAYRLAWQVVLPTVLTVSGFFVVLTTLVVRAHARQPHTGAEGLVGETGIVRKIRGGQGKVMVHGELWQAEFQEEAKVGDKVRVVEVRNLVVIVERVA